MVYTDKMGFIVHRLPRLTSNKIRAISTSVANASAFPCGIFCPLVPRPSWTIR